MVGGVRLGWPASASLLTGFTASLLVHLYPLSGEDLRVRMLPCKVLQGGFTLCKPKHRSAGVCVALWPSPVLPTILTSRQMVRRARGSVGISRLAWPVDQPVL